MAHRRGNAPLIGTGAQCTNLRTLATASASPNRVPNCVVCSWARAVRRPIFDEQRRAVGNREASFTNAYYAHPSELGSLLREYDFEVLALVACEGVVSMIDEQLRSLSGEAWRMWAELNYRLGKDPAVHGAA
jgi:hypothetical protein